MKQILFVSGSELPVALELTLSELNDRGYRFMTKHDFSKVVNDLKSSSIDTVIINSVGKKLESYQLAQEIKQYFKSSIKVFIYLPDSNVNEASKFGLVNAEVEDDKTINSLVNKISSIGSSEIDLDENIISVYSMDGGLGATSISLLLAEYLSNKASKVMIAETTNNFSMKRILGIEASHSILSKDYSSNYNQSKDLDWFRAFLKEAHSLNGVLYLNLFNDLFEKREFVDNFAYKIDELGQSLADLVKNLESNNQLGLTQNDLCSNLIASSNTLRLISREYKGDSLAYFFEILQLGSQLVENFIFDIGSDLNSSLNRQILKTSKNLIMVFRDDFELKTEFESQKKFLEQEYKINLIPVLVPDSYQQNKYRSFSKSDWLKVLGEVPLIYPYVPEAFASFYFDREALTKNKKLNHFAEELSRRIDPNNKSDQKNSGVLKLLEKKSLINWG